MATFKVPGDFTLHQAVHAAAASNDAENFIDIGATVHTTAAVELGIEFNSERQLAIRPDPTIPEQQRGTIVSGNSNPPIVVGAGAVTVSWHQAM